MSDQPDLPTYERASRSSDGFLQRNRQAQAAATEGFQLEAYNLPRNTSLNATPDLSAYRFGAPATARDPYSFSGERTAAGADPYRFSGDAASDRTRPPAPANDQLEQAKQILIKEGISAGDKLRVIQQLAKAGINHIQLPDKDGSMRDYEIRQEAIGNRTMVHLFAKDDQRREHVVLRGLANADGTFEKERDNRGRFVTFEGTWWSQHMSGRSALAQGETTAQDQGRDPYQYGGRTQRRRGRGRYSDADNGDQSSRRGYSDQNFDANGQNADLNRPISANAHRIADQASRVARSMGSVGWCAKGVAACMDSLGIRAEHANAWDYGHNLERTGMFERVPLSEARRGDIIVRSWNRSVIAQHGGRNWGDITTVVGKNGQGQLVGANDHHQVIAGDGGRYVNSFVLRLREPNDQYYA